MRLFLVVRVLHRILLPTIVAAAAHLHRAASVKSFARLAAGYWCAVVGVARHVIERNDLTCIE
jgi:hypothetical protein